VEDPKDRPTINEIHKMQRIWVLQCIYEVTAKKLFSNKDWYSKANNVLITYSRYIFLMNKLGAELPVISLLNRNSEAYDEEVADKVWGSFNEYNEVIGKLERHMGEIGQKFVFEQVTDITIDDDKLRHRSTSFRSEGLQQCGFRGSRCGPVMNCVGLVQSSLIVSLSFNRKGNGILNAVKSLMRFLGYGVEPHLCDRLDVVVMIDQGYHIPSVIDFILDLRMSSLGTHSEKAGNWCFCTGGDPKAHQKAIPIEGARAAFFASRKINNVTSTAMCYHNGSKGIGNVHSTLPYTACWDLVYKSATSDNSEKPIEFTNLATEDLYQRWMSQVTIFVACQAATPWFEARVGHLTGTTVLHALKVLKYVIADNVEERFRVLVNNLLCEVIGLSFARKTEAHLKGISQQSLKKAYKALGYKATKATSDKDMIAVIAKNAPSEALVFQQIIVSWCMTPIK
jgi:hypothetical protein